MKPLLLFQFNGQPVRIGESDLNAGKKNNHQPGHDYPDKGIGIDHANTNIAGKNRNCQPSAKDSFFLKKLGNNVACLMTGLVQVVIRNDLIKMMAE